MSISSFFTHTIHAPSSSTLFPSTTLFRSVSMNRNALSLASGYARTATLVWTLLLLLLSVQPAPAQQNNDNEYTRKDRKSTRLNSSHLVISYAVFCLKK